MHTKKSSFWDVRVKRVCWRKVTPCFT